GNSTIYTATWKNGPFTKWDNEQQELKRDGEIICILKTLKDLEKSAGEIEASFTIEPYSQSLVKCYGLTKDPETRTFMLILHKMDSDLRQFLEEISNSIRKLHNKGKIYKDLYPKNILINKDKLHCVLCDFGLCSSLIQDYGNCPYIAPE
ncbi:33291_t:CDS:2, partial [Racocetra persica]